MLEAADGDAARRSFAEDPQAVGAAILDVTMPPAGAVPVVDALLERCRGRFVRKPFAPYDLLAALREVAPG